MFDIGFVELLLCAVIALVVLGPDKLPELARSVGRWTGQARAYMRGITSELEREVNLREIRDKLDDANRLLTERARALQDEVRKIEEPAQSGSQDPEAGPQPGTGDPPSPPADSGRGKE